MRKDSEYLKVVDHLEAKIVSGAIGAGKKLPSLRQLEREFGFSLNSIRKGIDILRKKGIVEVRPGSGAFVSSTRAANVSTTSSVGNKRKISIFVSSNDLNSSYCAHSLNGLQLMANSKSNYMLLMNFLDSSRLQAISEDELQEVAGDCDGIIFLGCYDFLLRNLIVNKPCVGLEVYGSYGGVMSTVALDPVHAAEIACNFYKDRGFSKVIALSMVYPNGVFYPTYEYRQQVFKQHWLDLGGEICEYRETEQSCLSHINEKNTGFYFQSDSDFNFIATAYRGKYNRSLINDHCVLSIDGKSLLMPDFEPTNTIAVNWKQMGAIVLEECIRRIENPGSRARRIYQSCLLHEYNL